MTGTFRSSGLLRYSLEGGLYRLVLEVDPEIVRYYRALVPKHFHLARQKYPPHISVVREYLPVGRAIDATWGFYEGMEVPYVYGNQIEIDTQYAWLRVWSYRLRQLRGDLGFEDSTWYTRPPDGEDCEHITLGNRKELWPRG